MGITNNGAFMSNLSTSLTVTLGLQILATSNPSNLSASAFETLISELGDYTDTPSQATLSEMLSDSWWRDNVTTLNAKQLKAAQRLTISTNTVHRETF
jgi:hypothetical protein